MKYDDGTWHSGGDGFADDLPLENGATHIGMFLGWALTRGHAGPDILEDPVVKADIDKVLNREMSPRDFLIDHCDEQLIDEDLSEEANKFAIYYYENQYFTDYVDTFDDYQDIYAIDDTWENFDRMAAVIDERFQ